MRTFLTGQVHLGIALFTVIVAALVGVGAGMFLTRDTVLNYTLAVAPGQAGTEALQYGAWPELSNADFFEDVKKGFLEEDATFVEANLSAMLLRVYDKGALVAEVPIKSKGKEGSWWETPSGLYRAEGKERNHFSSFGHVNMPYSIPFQGNFFIHGWPTYEDGTPVASTYSGGCIRLADENAKLVYNLIEVGTPILVFEEGEREPFSYTLDVPDVTAQSYLVADLDNNFVLLAGETATPRETSVAATYMTALVASEWQNIEKEVPLGTEKDPTGLLTQDSYSIYELFFPLLLTGSDTAARALGHYFGTERFLRLSLTKARAIGMTNSRFADPAGVTGYNTTTAEDLFHLLKYLRSNRHFILDMSAGTTDTRTYGEPRFAIPTSTHPLHALPGFVGGAYSDGVAHSEPEDSTAAVPLAFVRTDKSTGGTRDLITVLEEPFGKTTRPLAFIVLDSEDPAKDTEAIRAFVRQMYQ